MVCWKSEFEYGIPMIDDQHERMFETCGQLFNLVYGTEMKAVSEEVIKLLREILSCSKIHFETEALLFNAMPLQAHSKLILEEQSMFLRSINDYLIQVQSLDSDKFDKIENLKVLLSYVLDWLVKHILVTDKKVIPFLKLSGHGTQLSVSC